MGGARRAGGRPRAGALIPREPARAGAASPSAPPKVLLACPGLDHAHRGFETFARECFEALRGRPDLSLELAKATGARRRDELVIRTPTRESRLARELAQRWSREPFVVEHVVFALALIPVLLHRRPDVVYFSEWHVGRVLGAWRRLSRQSFALVFCNGALAPGRYEHLDLVQQLVPGAIEYTAARGEPTKNQLLLPLGAAIEPSPALLGDAERATLRESLALPADRQIVVSAGAINTDPKRMDYMVEEIASMGEPRPYLLLLGEAEADTPAIRRLAMERLGADGHDIRTVASERMADYYRASDALVLASLWESFGRVLVEAQSHGLPCLAHDYPVMNWVLGEEGDTVDMRQPGSVAGWLRGLGSDDFSPDRRRRRHRSAYERFSWDVLADRYADMLRTAAGDRSAARGAACRVSPRLR